MKKVDKKKPQELSELAKEELNILQNALLLFYRTTGNELAQKLFDKLLKEKIHFTKK